MFSRTLATAVLTVLAMAGPAFADVPPAPPVAVPSVPAASPSVSESLAAVHTLRMLDASKGKHKKHHCHTGK